MALGFYAHLGYRSYCFGLSAGGRGIVAACVSAGFAIISLAALALPPLMWQGWVQALVGAEAWVLAGAGVLLMAWAGLVWRDATCIGQSQVMNHPAVASIVPWGECSSLAVEWWHAASTRCWWYEPS